MSSKLKNALMKFISLTVCAVMICATVPTFATGDGDGTPVATNLFEEDFESYLGTENVTGSNHTLAGNWKSSEDTRFGYDSNGRANIQADPTDTENQVLAIESRSAYQNNQAPIMENADIANLYPDKTYKLTFDMYCAGSNSGGGIRFMVADSDNYYQIYWQGGDPGDHRYSDGTKAMSMWKSTDGTRVRIGDDGMKVKSDTFPTGAFPRSQWYEMTVIFTNGEAYWTAVNKTTGIEDTSFSGWFLQPATITENGDGTVTVVDNKISTSGNVALKFFASGQGNQFTYFDNIVLNEYNVWTDGETEADNILYYNASKVMRSSEGVYDLLNSSKIRRITNNGEASDFTMQVSEDGETFSDDIEVEFDVDGKWINTEIDEKTRYIRFSDESVADNISIYCEVEGGESFDIVVSKELDFILREKGQDVTVPNILLADNYKLSSDGSTITANYDGNIDVTVYGTAIAKTVTINVIGEMKEAEINGTEDAYITAKKPIIDAISNATDSQTIYDIILSEDELKLSDIKDFDMTRINDLSDERLMLVAQALVDYTFEIEDIDDVRNFIDTVVDEINLAEICGVADNATIETLLESYNDTTYGLPLDNKYYLEYKDEVHTAMQNKTFGNVTGLQDYFVDTYIIIAYKNADSSEKVTDLIRNCAADIGIDADKYKLIKLKDLLSEQLILNKDSIDTVEELQEFIDSYEEDAEALIASGFVFADDFETYAGTENVNGKGMTLAGNWKSSEDTKFGYDSNGTARIEYLADDSNNVLALEGRSDYKNNDAPIMENADISNLDPDKTYKLEFDMYFENTQAGGGIRFMVGNGNYYQLYWQGSNGYGDGTKRMSIWRTGERIGEDAIRVKSGTYPDSAFPNGKWHHMTVVFANGEAYWTAVDKTTGDENTSFSGWFVQPATITDNGDGTVDIKDNKLVQEDTVALKFFASGQGGQYVYFDNIVLKEHNVWTDGKTEADNNLYYNASDIMRLSTSLSSTEEGVYVYDLLNDTKIRRITKESGDDTVTIGVSEDGVTYTDVVVNFTDGKWINIEMDAKVRYIKFADESTAENINIYCEVEGGETFDVFVGKSLDFVLREKGQDVSYQKIANADTYRLGSDDLSVTGLRDGVVGIQVYGAAVAKEVSINVVGEIGEAEINGTEDAYITAKKPIIDAISNATDAQTIYDIMKSEGELKLSDIKDIDMDILAILTEDEYMHVAQALVDYTFDIQDLDDVRDFIQTILDEINLLNVLNLEDNETIEAALKANNISLELPLENKYYLDYKDDVLTAMQGKDFENIMELQKYFADTYVMTAFKGATGYETIGVIVEECATEIGYSANKLAELAKIDGAKTSLYEQMKLNQSNLDTVEEIRNYINSYEAPEAEDEEESDSDIYYGGGGGGGSSITLPAVVTTTNVPNADNTVVGKKQLYPDVPINHWAYDGIRYLSAVKAASGYDDATFRPGNSITRGEFVKMLMVAFEIEIPTVGEEDELPFADITAADWYTPYFVAANNAEIVLGDGGNANANVLISRQEIAVMIDRVVKMQGKVLPKTNGLVRFDDESNIADWAYSAISRMQIANIINGDGTGNFLPKNDATRAESAKMIYGAVQKAYVEPEPVQEETVNE